MGELYVCVVALHCAERCHALAPLVHWCLVSPGCPLGTTAAQPHQHTIHAWQGDVHMSVCGAQLPPPHRAAHHRLSLTMQNPPYSYYSLKNKIHCTLQTLPERSPVFDFASLQHAGLGGSFPQPRAMHVPHAARYAHRTCCDDLSTRIPTSTTLILPRIVQVAYVPQCPRCTYKLQASHRQVCMPGTNAVCTLALPQHQERPRCGACAWPRPPKQSPATWSSPTTPPTTSLTTSSRRLASTCTSAWDNTHRRSVTHSSPPRTHRQPNHPICIIKTAIYDYFDAQQPGFAKHDELYPIVSVKAV